MLIVSTKVVAYSDIGAAKVSDKGVFARQARLLGNIQGCVWAPGLPPGGCAFAVSQGAACPVSSVSAMRTLTHMGAGPSVAMLVQECTYSAPATLPSSFSRWLSQFTLPSEVQARLIAALLTALDGALLSSLAFPVGTEMCLVAVSVCICLFSCGHWVIFCLVPFSLTHFYVGLFACNCYFVGVHYIQGINSLVYVSANNFSHSRLSFPSLNSVFRWPEVLNFNVIQFILFFSFMISVFCVLFKTSFPVPRSWHMLLSFLLKALVFYLSHLDLQSK